MKALPALAALALVLGPPLAAADADRGGEDDAPDLRGRDDERHDDAHDARHGARNSTADPAGDETAHLVLPVSGPWNDLASCRDPSVDIVSVTATASRKTLRVEVVHAAPVLAPQLSCSGAPVAVARQQYGLAIEGDGDNFLFLSVDASEACLYILFADPAQASECIQAVQVDGAAIRMEADLRGLVSVGEGVTRPYKLAGAYAIHAFAEEEGAPRPGPGPGIPFVPGAMLHVADESDTDLVLHLRG